MYFLLITGCDLTLEVAAFSVTNMTYKSAGNTTTCQYNITSTNEEHLIRLTFPQGHHNINDVTNSKHKSSTNCIDDYIHIGNNIQAVNMESMTSYLFCGDDYPPQIVSRRHTAWVVIKHAQDINTVDFVIESLPKGMT